MIQYKEKYKDEVKQRTYEANLRRFAQLLNVDEESMQAWSDMHVHYMGVTRAHEELYAFCDTRFNDSALFNEHGVCVWKNFGVGEFV